ncbi:MAG: GTP-binding protein [Candidatus Poriferisodalaceae bacterium]|jgi:GTP-binding protein|nr:ribosome biogenesis GTPase Der [Acidimicrobiales bacterium]|tara:strand:- start:219 stop:1532 length:1314 start_codon:yes stop_codon:yes gene_type:complete
MAELPVVSVIGRPNVGKSTLFNRIIGRREAIVEERSGVTRDRKTLEAEWSGNSFLLVDTGGWMPSGTDLDEKVSAQSEKAMYDSDLLLMLVDATTGITEEDSRIASLLRRIDTNVLLVVNKVDHSGRDLDVWNFMGLGLGEPFAVSALHSRHTGDLLDRIVEMLPSEADDEDVLSSLEIEDDGVPGVAIVGRPNVGKSTLFNRMIGDERSVVHDMPGTTRDAIDTVVDTDLGPVRFIDTAGMRRKARVDDDTEYYSNLRALRALDKADVALLVIDASEGVTAQDQRLAERVDGAGCPIVVLMNKWEVLDQEQKDEVMYQVGQRLHFLGESPILRISARTGQGVHRLIPALEAAINAYETRVPTRKVNEVIQLAQSAQPGPHGARVLYATQGAAQPPTFTLFSNKEIPASYMRYLERKLREAFDLGATPIRMRVRRRG